MVYICLHGATPVPCILGNGTFRDTARAEIIRATAMLPSRIRHDIPAVIQEIPRLGKKRGHKRQKDPEMNWKRLPNIRLDDQMTMIGLQ